jgi:carboxylesterase type B
MFSKSTDAFVEKIYDFYVSKVDESNQILIRKAYIAIYTDTWFKCPVHYYTKNFAHYSPANNLRTYELTYNSIHSGCHSPAWKGICHTDELTFVFGAPIQQKTNFPQIEYDFSVMINKMWTDFAKTGYLLIIF